MDIAVHDNLQRLYRERGFAPGAAYRRSVAEALSDQLAYGTPAMYGIVATVLSSEKMIAYNMLQNSIDEAKGAARIQIIADRYADDELGRKMHRHVGEEMKHSKQFLGLIDATGFETEDTGDDPEAVEDVLDFDDDLRAFLCRVHSIEIRSWTVLRMYQDVLADRRFPRLTDSALPVLADIMNDEINHVFYTGQQVDRWLGEDPGLQDVLDECLAHTNRETWQDMASMTTWLAGNFDRVLVEDAPLDMPTTRFVVGDMGPTATLT